MQAQILKKVKLLNPLYMQRVFYLLILMCKFPIFAQTYICNQSRWLSDACIGFPTPAIAVARIRLDTIEYGYTGFITSKRKPKEKVQEHTKYHLGSNTKAITALLAAKLVEMGYVRWESTLLELLPEFESQIDTGYYQKTLSDFLTHSAGVAAFTDGEDFVGLPTVKGTITEQRKAFAKFILKKKPDFDTKDSFKYSNAGYLVAAVMLEKATERSWEIVLKYALDTMFLRGFIGFPNKENPKLNAWGHFPKTDTSSLLIPTAPNHAYKLPNWLSPAGDLSMPILDYAILIQQFLKGVCGQNGFVKAADFERLVFGKNGYAFGWRNFLDKDGKGLRVAMHDGSLGSFYTRTVIDAQKKTALVILTNTADAKTIEQLLPKIEQKLMR